MLCKLCLKEKKLCKQSHIIPDFLHRELFDDKHRLIKFSTDRYNCEQNVPTGEYESNILCEDCDGRIIGQYESYARIILYGGAAQIRIQNYIQPDGLKYTKVENVNYKKFKLFLLSLVWRSSISSRDFFRDVTLGPYEEKLRKMIYSGDPGPENSYTCFITSFRKYITPQQMIMNPKKIELEGKTGYLFFISGFLYIFKITERENQAWFLDASINKQGAIKILDTPEEKAREIIGKFLDVTIPLDFEF